MWKNLWAGLAAMHILAVPLQAETPAVMPPGFVDFSAKRVAVPKPGERRLTVQIDPDAQRAALAALPKPGDRPALNQPERDQTQPAATAPPGAFDWFWERVSPTLANATPGRLPGALDAILGRQDLPQPRLSALKAIAQANGSHILRATIGTQVSPALVLAVISVESAGRADAVSHAGAEGLMQLMPDTAKRFGVKDSFRPDENISGGVKYLDWLMREFGGDPILVLAGYNAGEGSVQKYSGVPPFPETRGYVEKILTLYTGRTYRLGDPAIRRVPVRMVRDGSSGRTVITNHRDATPASGLRIERIGGGAARLEGGFGAPR
jgi:soluble lytic murein transglycosylase-like protein